MFHDLMDAMIEESSLRLVAQLESLNLLKAHPDVSAPVTPGVELRIKMLEELINALESTRKAFNS